MPFERNAVATKLAALADEGIFIGTSSWKYAAWRGRLYDEARYVWRGKFAETRFEKNCLTEYAEVFRAVGVDSTFYTFPSQKSLEGLASQVPPGFQFGFKVTEEITVKHFPNHPRAGARGGKANVNFLNYDLFERAFSKPCEFIRTHVGILMFEFGD